MTTQNQVHVEWGPFMNSCYISLMQGEKFGPTLHLSNETPSTGSLPSLLHGLSTYNKQQISLNDVRPHLPPRESIAWDDELKGDKFMGYEIRGLGDGFRAWVSVKHGDFKGEVTDAERSQLLDLALRTRDLFFPA